MTALLAPPKARTAPTPFVPKRHLWTNEEFCRMGDRGDFEGRNVILVDGEILDMPNPGPDHDMSVSLADYLLKDLFRGTHIVRVQTGLPTGLDTNPCPDLAVVVGSPRDYPTWPRTAALVVEVADSSLWYDRGEKSNLYAAAGIPEYWVIDVAGRELLVFRDPVADAVAPRGHRYGTATTLADTGTVSPLAAPTAVVKVTDLLP